MMPIADIHPTVEPRRRVEYVAVGQQQIVLHQWLLGWGAESLAGNMRRSPFSILAPAGPSASDKASPRLARAAKRSSTLPRCSVISGAEWVKCTVQFDSSIASPSAYSGVQTRSPNLARRSSTAKLGLEKLAKFHRGGAPPRRRLPS